ncbi:9129_t:CDS:2, partial [Funneliformis geosporum]
MKKHGDNSGYLMPASTGFHSKDIWGYSGFSLSSFRSLYVEMKLLTMCRSCKDSNLAFDIAFEGVCSLRDIEMVVKPLSDKEIKDNMGDLKKKLARSTTSHAEELPILSSDIWKSPAFTPKFENTQSEGTYVTDVI